MKVGLIARSEDRGLGNLTWEWAEHVRPERVLLIVPDHRIPQRFDRYAEHETTTIGWDPSSPELHGAQEAVVRHWLGGLDVVYSAETFYDWRICDWARDRNVRTVCHVMPEFYRHGGRDRPSAPDVWWAPTRWRLETLDPSTRVVPVPIALERFRRPRQVGAAPTRWLHVAGTRAAGDRNGTRLFINALRHLQERHEVTIRSQGRRFPPPRSGRATSVVVGGRSADEYWDLYRHADALVLPRRYAGLSLPALEAMGAGLAVMMTDVEPQRSEWPIMPLRPTAGRMSVVTPAGTIGLAAVEPRVIAEAMDAVARKRSLLVAARGAAQRFARANSWEALGPTITAELERALA